MLVFCRTRSPFIRTLLQISEVFRWCGPVSSPTCWLGSGSRGLYTRQSFPQLSFLSFTSRRRPVPSLLKENPGEPGFSKPESTHVEQSQQNRYGMYQCVSVKGGRSLKGRVFHCQLKGSLVKPLISLVLL